MQIPILKGVFTDLNSDVRISYPRNLIPVPKDSGLSAGYLRPMYGIEAINTSHSGVSRGAINWDGTHYRVIGENLIRLDKDGNTAVVGSVGAGVDSVSMDYSFDHLAIVSNRKLFLYDKISLQQVTDTDLGSVIDVTWVDGFFMLTDGTYLVLTELADPFEIIPTKYGSSEVDPDPIVAVKKLRNESYAINRYSIEAFDNVGGSGFPFRTIDGAKVNRGAVGTKACCIYNDAIAFVGNGRNESVAIWLAAGGTSVKLSTQEIDSILSQYTEEELQRIEVESVLYTGQYFLMIHLPDQTLVHDAYATAAVNENIWFTLSTSVDGASEYRARHFCFCYNEVYVGDTRTASVGKIRQDISSCWGEVVGHEFATQMLFAEGMNAILHDIELVTLPGRNAFLTNPVIWTSYSIDGLLWSEEKSISIGSKGAYAKRLRWFNQGLVNHKRVQKFRWLSDAQLSVLRLDINFEALLY